MIIVRYSDDFIIGFQHEPDTRRFLDLLRERMGKFALAFHPEKTRLIEFGRFAAENRRQRGLGKPEAFNFLGFTFICGKSRQGYFLVHRKTRRDRMRVKLQEIKQGPRQLRVRLPKEKVKVSQSGISRFLRHINLTFKKSLTRGRTRSLQSGHLKVVVLGNDKRPVPTGRVLEVYG